MIGQFEMIMRKLFLQTFREIHGNNFWFIIDDKLIKEFCPNGVHGPLDDDYETTIFNQDWKGLLLKLFALSYEEHTWYVLHKVDLQTGDISEIEYDDLVEMLRR